MKMTDLILDDLQLYKSDTNRYIFDKNKQIMLEWTGKNKFNQNGRAFSLFELLITKMECFDLGEIRKYIERGSKKYTCRTNVPEKIVISIQLLFNTLIDQIGKDANAVTPQDIVDLINDVPEYDFLKPLIPSING